VPIPIRHTAPEGTEAAAFAEAEDLSVGEAAHS
jgi:hypothetical protein